MPLVHVFVLVVVENPMPADKVVYSMWVSVSASRHLSSAQMIRPKLIHLIGSTEDPEVALGRAGEILSAMGITDMRVRTTRVQTQSSELSPLAVDDGTAEAVEVYGPNSLVGVVVIGVSVVDDVGVDDFGVDVGSDSLESWWGRSPVGQA
jgi:hypothetical protein